MAVGRERKRDGGWERGRENWRTGGRRGSLYKDTEASARNASDTGKVKEKKNTVKKKALIKKAKETFIRKDVH